MVKHPERKMITDQIGLKLEAPLKEARHSAAGALGEMSDREFLAAVLYLLRTGSPWRDLPSAPGYWPAVSTRFRRRKAGPPAADKCVERIAISKITAWEAILFVKCVALYSIVDKSVRSHHARKERPADRTTAGTFFKHPKRRRLPFRERF